MRSRVPAALLALVLLPASARADSLIDGMEHVFGATDVHAVTGHGRLTVGVARDGDLSVLLWPNPSYVDQLAMITSNAFDARSRPRFGAAPGTGAFFGLALEASDGTRRVVWLHDEAVFAIAQDYGPGDGGNPRTRFEATDLGVSVTLVDAVDPDADVLVRQVTVTLDASADVAAAWLLTYANLEPLPPTSRIPEVPLVDWALDGRSDFAAVWDASRAAVIAFHPQGVRDYASLGSVITPQTIDWGVVGEQLVAGTPDEATLASLAAGLDADHGEGTYLALTTVPPPDQHQVGYDASPLCDTQDELVDNLFALAERFPDRDLPIDPDLLNGLRCDRSAPSIPEAEGWTHVAADAFGDAMDGELEGSGIAAGEVSEVLRTPLTFDGGVATASMVLSAGPTAATAREGLTSDPDAVIGRAEDALTAFLGGLTLPTEGPPDVLRVARRTVINIRVGTVAETGAIVASIARQAPYGLDWPRDGFYFNVLLDLTGQHALAEQRTALYADWQRTVDVMPTPIVDPPAPPPPGGGRGRTYPAGAWEMNYYGDGMVGGPFRFEIDETAFAVAMLVAHVGWVEPERREAYLRSRWDAIERGADLLERWRDPDNRLAWPAQEDDNTPYTQTLHGSVTVFGALDLASRAARLLGEDERAAAWEARATELRAAILEHLYDADAGRFVSHPDTAFDPAGPFPTGQTAWAVWPMRLLPWDDARIRDQLAFDLETIRPTIDLETEGGSYFAKTLLSAALLFSGDPTLGSEVARQRDALAAQASTGTDHYGEVMLVVDGAADQRVCTPHLWAGTLFFLSAMAVEDPDALVAWDAALPPSRVGEEPPAPMITGGGCCAVAPRRSRLGPLLLAPLLALAITRRR